MGVMKKRSYAKISMPALLAIATGMVLLCIYFARNIPILKIFLECEIVVSLAILVILYVVFRYIKYYKNHQIDDSFARLLDSVGYAAIKIGRNGTIKAFNKKSEALFGYKKNNILNKNIKILFKKDDVSVFSSKGIKHCLLEGQSKIHISARKKNRDIFPVEISMSKIEELGATQFMLIFYDMSHSKATEESLNQHIADLHHMIDRQIYELRLFKGKAEVADNIKSEFISNISHELKTPMHAILSFSRMGIERIGSIKQEKLLEYFSDIRKSGERLLRLLNELLDISKLEAGHGKLNLAQNDLCEVLQDVLDEMSSLSEEKNLKIEINKPDFNANLIFDREKIIQVLVNIISNAIKFTPQNGLIKIDFSEFCLISNSLSEHELEMNIGMSKYSIESDLLFIAHSPPIKALVRLEKNIQNGIFYKKNTKHFIGQGKEILDEFANQEQYKGISFYTIKNKDKTLRIKGINHKIAEENKRDAAFEKWHNKLHKQVKDMPKGKILHAVYIPQNYDKDGMLCSIYPIYREHKLHGFIEIETLLNNKMMARVVRNSRAAMISIFNEGSVVMENELNNIFDKFIQGSTTKTGAGGSGLGLSISKEIIALHRGKIWAESEKTTGTTFRFVIPVIPDSNISLLS